MNAEGVTLAEVIEQKYKSLEQPDYSFVSKAVSSKPYEKLVQQFKELFEIEEITDTNDDVSFRYLVSKSENQWIVELSMVGLYAVVLRVPNAGLSETVTLDSSIKDEQDICSLLVSHHFELLAKSELEKPLALNLCNTDPSDVRLYQALFSDTERLPWKV